MWFKRHELSRHQDQVGSNSFFTNHAQKALKNCGCNSLCSVEKVLYMTPGQNQPKHSSNSEHSRYHTWKQISTFRQTSKTTNQLYKNIRKNGYLDTSTQKRGLEGFAVCWKHYSMISKLHRDAEADAGRYQHAMIRPRQRLWLSSTQSPERHKVFLWETEVLIHCGRLHDELAATRKKDNNGNTIYFVIFHAVINIMIKTAENECKWPKINIIL